MSVGICTQAGRQAGSKCLDGDVVCNRKDDEAKRAWCNSRVWLWLWRQKQRASECEDQVGNLWTGGVEAEDGLNNVSSRGTIMDLMQAWVQCRWMDRFGQHTMLVPIGSRQIR